MTRLTEDQIRGLRVRAAVAVANPVGPSTIRQEPETLLLLLDEVLDARGATAEKDPCTQIRAVLDALPDEAARKNVLSRLLAKRCRTCFDYDPSGHFWCCYDSRGG